MKLFTKVELAGEKGVGVFIVLRCGNYERAVENFPVRLGSYYWDNEMDWTCRTDGSNENCIKKFRKKIEGMSDLRKTFQQFSICYAAYSVFSPETYSY
jgi:hypothetical protein